MRFVELGRASVKTNAREIHDLEGLELINPLTNDFYRMDPA
jgi:hypothetical protein